MMKNIIIAIALALLVGCAYKTRKPPVAVRTSPLQPFISKANVAAQQVLKEFNSSDSSQRLGGPFTLTDYDTKTSMLGTGGKIFVVVSYKLNKPVSFKGHPEHFDVHVEKSTDIWGAVIGVPKVFNGR